MSLLFLTCCQCLLVSTRTQFLSTELLSDCKLSLLINPKKTDFVALRYSQLILIKHSLWVVNGSCFPSSKPIWAVLNPNKRKRKMLFTGEEKQSERHWDQVTRWKFKKEWKKSVQKYSFMCFSLFWLVMLFTLLFFCSFI